ncbi:extracellular solute-binding protein [Eubacteriales bacterium OttesenSCG-928-G02]|nr:extracellular solute-binding protein [Eubacteriales bacterium OttesenSCG-928-G02]
MKKIISLLLVLLMVVVVLVSCDNNSNESTQGNNSQTTSNNSNDPNTSEDPLNEYQDSNGRYVSKLEVKDFQKREFRIYVRKTTGIYSSDDFTTDSEYYDETINEAVAKRNSLVEEKYNVVLKVIKDDQINTNIKTAINTGDDLYDAIMPTIPILTQFAQDGMLYDLTMLENFDNKAPWWDKNATEAFSVKNRLFFTTGDITILNKVCSPSVLFNKDIIEVEKMEDPYQLVLDKKWTFDKMYEMAKQATKEIDGETGLSGNDQWGIVAAHMDSLIFYGAAGEKLCVKNSDDLPELSYGSSQRTIDVAQKIIDRMTEVNSWVIYAQDYPEPIWETSFAAFHEGRVLFRPSGFSATTKLRAYENLNFGILPVPLWTEDQDQYYSYCGTGEVAGIAIPLSCKDPEFAAYMIDVYACEAKNELTPAYMEVNLKIKDAQNDKDLPMLNIIFDNITYDIGEVYNFGTIKTLFSKLVSSKSTALSSSFEAIEKTIEEDIKKVIEQYDS